MEAIASSENHTEDNRQRERQFLMSVVSGASELEFPRSPYNKLNEIDFREARDYLIDFTKSRPKFNFLMFEVTTDDGDAIPKLAKLDISTNQEPEPLKLQLEESTNQLMDKIEGQPNPFFLLVSQGDSYFAYATQDSQGSIGFRGDGFMTYFQNPDGKVLGKSED